MLASQAPGASTVTELLAQTPESAAASQDSPAVEGQANPASTPAPDETATNAAGTQPAPEPEQTAAISPAAQAPIPATTLDTPPAATPDNEDLQVPAEPVSGTHVDDFLNENAQAPELIALKASEFMMGNPVGPPDSDARPVHKVSLDAFMIGAKEVTFADYDRYVRATGARRPQDYGWGRGSRPVIDVTWQEAQDYAAWLSEQTGKPYRLPTEAEWEYAARGGTTSSYWWGIGSPSSRALCVNCGTRWDKLSTAPVGSFPPNAFGLYDTAGNVYEWTQDCYHQNYKKAASDGAARTKPGCELRVARGGSFNSPASAMRSHARNHFTSDSRIDMLGFRIARDLYPSDDN
ncbi:hypothetical protein CKO36_01595 [Rhabdochromatium marinum]|nr:hypothetical protein [Rhabdochromatium marinum]